MKLIRTINEQEFKKSISKSIVVIGKFDGFHIGHQQLIRKATELQNKSNLPIILITFNPNPSKFFYDKHRKEIYTIKEKLTLIKTQFKQISKVLLLKFDSNFASLRKAQFLEQYIVNYCNAEHVVIGYDFKFGKKTKGEHQGDVNYLRSMEERYNFKTNEVAKFTQGNQAVSSTILRQSITDGNVDHFYKLAGRHYEVQGIVQRGRRLASSMLNHPTANVNFKNRKLPLRFGVYSVEVVIDSKKHKAIANFGIKPTIDGDKILLEVHIFDFNQDIYGKKMKVKFLTFIRNEKKFDSLDDLKKQITQDIKIVKQNFNS